MPDPVNFRKILAGSGLSPKKRFGQNFMVSDAPLRAIAGALSAPPGAPVLEIGPGAGFLTQFLVERGYRVTALEKDRDCARVLQKRFAGSSLRVVEGDILSGEPGKLGLNGRFAVAGNIPYNITSPILEWLVGHRAVVCEAVLTVQKEVAGRLLAEPGTKAWGALTIFVRTFADISLVRTIGRSAFFPPPKVDSAAIRLTFLDKPRHAPGDEAVYSGIVRKAFQKRRKTILNALDGICVGARRAVPLHKPELLDVLNRCSVDPRRRPETLTLAEWAGLSVRLSSALPAC